MQEYKITNVSIKWMKTMTERSLYLYRGKAFVFVFFYYCFIYAIPMLISAIFPFNSTISFFSDAFIFLKTLVYPLVVFGPFIYGLTLFFIKLSRKHNPLKKDIFVGFIPYTKATGLFLWTMLFVILWSLIPVAGMVLGPLAAIRYSQAYYILIDNPQFSIRECVNASKDLMAGNKWLYVKLHLSYIGWYLLASIPFLLVQPLFLSDITSPLLITGITMISLAGFYVVEVNINTALVFFYRIATKEIVIVQ